MSSSQLQYISKYNKQNYKMYQFRIRKNESELIECLDNIPNRNRYIRDLILENLRPQVLTIKQIKERIRPIIKRHNIKDVFLFGSYARGEANRNSDVDIYCSAGDLKTLYDLTTFIEELEQALEKRVDVVTIGSDMPEFFRQQLEEDMIKIC